jgi:hypothetical protein
LDVDGDEICIDQKFLNQFAASLSAGKLDVAIKDAD